MRSSWSPRDTVCSHVDQSPESCHVIAGFHRLINADQPLLGVAQWLDAFLLALVADLSGLLLAVLDVAVLLGFLGTSLHLELVNFLRLEIVALLLNWEGEDIGELLTIPVYVNPAYLFLGLSRDVVTTLVHLKKKNVVH